MSWLYYTSNMSWLYDNIFETHLAHERACCLQVRELSTLIADQGAPRQPLHPDVHYHPYPQLYTCFIALQGSRSVCVAEYVCLVVPLF